MTPSLTVDRVFQDRLAARDAELQAIADTLVDHMRIGSDTIRARMKNPSGNTTSLAVREAALKRSIPTKVGKLAKLAGQMSELMVTLHMDETELALVIEARSQSAIEYWKRLADGRVYAGARAMLDQLHNGHGIDATKLAGLTQRKIDRIGWLITAMTEKRDNVANG